MVCHVLDIRKMDFKKNYVEWNLWMKQEKEHQEMHLNIVAEERELNKNQKNWLYKIYAFLTYVLLFLFFGDYEILYSGFKVLWFKLINF